MPASYRGKPPASMKLALADHRGNTSLRTSDLLAE